LSQRLPLEKYPRLAGTLIVSLKEGQRATVLQLPATLERVKAAQPDKAKASEGQST
jgi:hypothetical protein